MVGRIRDLVKYQLERFLLGGAHYRLIFIAVLIVIVSFLGGWFAGLVDPELSSIENASWWAFLRLSDPGYLGDDTGIGKRIIATIVTLLGYVLFMGALVAIMTQWLHSTIRRLESGFTPLSKNGHVLILGWTNRSASIIREILSSGGRLKRFLKRIQKGGVHVVVLAPEVGPELSSELKEELGDYWDARKITFRTGIPLRAEDLKRVDLLHASVVILPGKALYEEAIETIDAGNIKTLLSISNLATQYGIEAPPVVTEIMDESRSVIAEKSYSGKIESVNSIAIISRILCQDLRNPGMSAVYSELLTQEYGSSLYVRKVDPQDGKSWLDVVGRYESAIPIGVVRSSTATETNENMREVTLAPSPSFKIHTNDELVFIARSLEESKLQRKKQSKPTRINQKIDLSKIHGAKNILILGWSQKIQFILDELQNSTNEKFDITIVSVLDVQQREKALSKYRQEFANIRINHVEADYTVPRDIDNLRPEKFDFALFLASDWIHSREDTDARTILGYLLLEGIIKHADQKPGLLVELMDPANEGLISKGTGEVIISPRIISHLMGSIALRMDLNGIFNELLGSGGAEFSFVQASRFINQKTCGFTDLQDLASESGLIPIGVRKTNSQKSIYIAPVTGQSLDIRPEDEIIVLGRNDYD